MQQHKNDIFIAAYFRPNGISLYPEWKRRRFKVRTRLPSLCSLELLDLATCAAVTDAAHVSPSPTAAAHLSAVF